jgi:hypothetical protein
MTVSGASCSFLKRKFRLAAVVLKVFDQAIVIAAAPLLLPAQTKEKGPSVTLN